MHKSHQNLANFKLKCIPCTLFLRIWD